MQKCVSDLKRLHYKLMSKYNDVRLTMAANEKNFCQSLMNNSSRLTPSMYLIKTEELEECNKVVKELNQIEEDLSGAFDYTPLDRQHMSILFGTDMKKLQFRTSSDDYELGKFENLVKIAQSSYFEKLNAKFLDEKEKSLIESNKANVTKLKEFVATKCTSLKAELDTLNVSFLKY